MIRGRAFAARRPRSSLGACRARHDRAQVRLAELVAALSLGIDLGFGQPMEHVLRQCLIALRLAERIGLDEERARGRLLHGAARQRRLPHRRARAGEVVRRRHRAEVGQVRPRARAACARRRLRHAAAGRGQPAAAPLPRRARVRALGHTRGGRDDRAPRARSRATLGEQLGLPERGARGARRGLRAVGRARLAGRARGRGRPARGAARAARRVRRGRAPRRRRRGGEGARAQAQRQAVRPGARAAHAARRRR